MLGLIVWCQNALNSSASDTMNFGILLYKWFSVNVVRQITKPFKKHGFYSAFIVVEIVMITYDNTFSTKLHVLVDLV